MAHPSTMPQRHPSSSASLTPTPATTPSSTPHDLLIIGAGIHGLILAKTYLEASFALAQSSPRVPAPPLPSVLLLDSTPSAPGGVWSPTRLYPGLKTNNLLGSYEFSDFPLEGGRRYAGAGAGVMVKAGEHIPGEVVGMYLGECVERFGLAGCLRLGRRVVGVELTGDEDGVVGWRVSAGRVRVPERARVGGEMKKEEEEEEEGEVEEVEEVFHATRLAVCTGSTSLPNMPSFVGQEKFDRPVVHSADLTVALPLLVGQPASTVPNGDASEEMRQYVVIGGNKSAFDAAYALAMGLGSAFPSSCAEASLTASSTNTIVHVLLRPSGGGPSWVWPRYITPFKLSVQRLATTRMFTLFDPTPWTRYQGLRWLLHCTVMGRLVVGFWWWIVALFIGSGRGDGNGEEGRRRADMFRPWAGVEWVGNSLSVDNYDGDFWELVRQGRIRAVVSEVTELGERGKVVLSTGDILEDVQAVVCCTGWKPSPSFSWSPEGLERDLGLPVDLDEAPECKTKQEVAERNKGPGEAAIVREAVLRETPMLRQRPKRHLPVPISSPSMPPTPAAKPLPRSAPQSWRLYRNLIPVPTGDKPHQRNIAFLGTQLSVATTLVAQAQALWVTAYFLDRSQQKATGTDPAWDPPLFCLPPPTSMYRTALKDAEYQRLRHPAEAGGAGERCADLVFDSLGYVDLLLEDLGVDSRRKIVGRRKRRRIERDSKGEMVRQGEERWLNALWEVVIEQWEELTQRYWPADYRGLVEEWKDVVDQRRRRNARDDESLKTR